MLSKTHIVGIISLAYLLVAGLMLGFVLYEVAAAGSELQTRVALIAEKNAKLKNYTELSKLIEDTEVQRQEIASYVLTEEKTSAFLTEIENLGTAAGVVLTTVSLKVVEKEGRSNDLAIEFAISGRENAVKKMLALLESLPYHSRLTSLSLAQSNGDQLKGNIQLNVTLLKHDK